MGWGDCGNDSKGRPIGYVFEATCDHPGCEEKIDRGLSYACGGMHGEDVFSCEKYFCEKHLSVTVEELDGHLLRVCKECGESFKEPDSGMVYDEEEGVWREELP